MIGRATLPEHKIHRKESELQELKNVSLYFVLVGKILLKKKD
jgi:hypothetical protein